MNRVWIVVVALAGGVLLIVGILIGSIQGLTEEDVRRIVQEDAISGPRGEVGPQGPLGPPGLGVDVISWPTPSAVEIVEKAVFPFSGPTYADCVVMGIEVSVLKSKFPGIQDAEIVEILGNRRGLTHAKMLKHGHKCTEVLKRLQD